MKLGQLIEGGSRKMDYKYIRAWNEDFRSSETYLECRVQEARDDNAPETAIFKDINGVWHVWEDIGYPDIKQRIAFLASQY
jgi:hypothetical protein